MLLVESGNQIMCNWVCKIEVQLVDVSVFEGKVVNLCYKVICFYLENILYTRKIKEKCVFFVLF